MTEADLLKLINDVEMDLHQNTTLYKSPGFAHFREIYGRFKTDKFVQETFCKLFSVDPLKVPEIIAAADAALLLEDGLVAKTPDRVAFLDKLKSHDFILKTIAKLLG